MDTKLCIFKIRFRSILLFLALIFFVPSCGVYLLFDEENDYFTEERKNQSDRLAIFGLLQSYNSSVPIVFSSTEFTTPTWGPATYSIFVDSIPSYWLEQNFQFNIFIQAVCSNVSVNSVNGVQGSADSSQIFFAPNYSSILIQVDGNTAGMDCKVSGYCDISHSVHNPIPQLLSQGQALGTVRAHFPPTCSF
ncbi:hypothetical protein [Leptospira johnsonii]|uniref:hypothetical protein n=1 Tax=Leptospira johnsonii TaxID=1917820 RepID=UPI000D59EF41|nr:hypothetical protein [Leptospira johnsonii]